MCWLAKVDGNKSFDAKQDMKQMYVVLVYATISEIYSFYRDMDSRDL